VHERMEITLDDLTDESRQIAEVIGLDNLLALARWVGGGSIYIPKLGCLTRAERNRAIRAEFNGRNYRELAQKYGLTVRWVRALVSGQAADGSAGDSCESIYKQRKLF